MCKSGCHNEDCWGDCTVSYNYCEVEKMDRIKEFKEDIETLERAIKKAENEDNIASAESLYLWLSAVKEKLSNLEEPEEEKEYRLEREEENRER